MDGDVIITGVKTAEEVLKERVEAAEANGSIIELDGNGKEEKQDANANDSVQFISVKTAEEEIHPDNTEIERADRIPNTEDKEEEADELTKAKISDEDATLISGRLTKLFHMTAAAAADTLCNECEKASTMKDNLVCCSQCQLKFHESCLKELYHTVIDDIIGHFVCPECKNLHPERQDSDDDISEYSDGND